MQPFNGSIQWLLICTQCIDTHIFWYKCEIKITMNDLCHFAKILHKMAFGLQLALRKIFANALLSLYLHARFGAFILRHIIHNSNSLAAVLIMFRKTTACCEYINGLFHVEPMRICLCLPPSGGRPVVP